MEFYKENIDRILKYFNSSYSGLTNFQAEKKLKKYGYNEIITKSKISGFKIFIDQFKSFIIYILIFAAILTLILGHYSDAIIIIIILISNAVLGFIQEYSAKKELEAMKNISVIKSKIFRNSKLIELKSREIVPGDIIYLEAGDKVPADIRLFEINRLKVEESSLTGESVPIEKNLEKINKNTIINEQKNMLFSNTLITEGSCKGIVVKTGMETEIGKISSMIDNVEEKMTPLQKKLDLFGKKLGNVIILICLFIFFVLILTKGFSYENIILFGLIAVSLAVAAVPTALPAVVTLSLSIGVRRLLKKKALVRKLSSVETLGSCDVICTDKTGTLTQNKMVVVKAWTFDKEINISGVGYNPVGILSGEINKLLFKIGSICNNASLFKENNMWQILGDPTEACLLVSSKKAGLKIKAKRLDEIPFDSKRKMMSVLAVENNKLFVYSKGALDNILKKCSYILINGRKERLTEKIKNTILEQNLEYSQLALRVLAFAYKEIKLKDNFTEENLIFVGLQAIEDPPREDVIKSIKKTKEAGILVIMITGDYKETAKAIGEKVGITGKILTGSELMNMSKEDLKIHLKNDTNIFARVAPKHKKDIITCLQELGHIVAMTGDGVNDAPALKKADIGIAVGSGTDIAKNSADLILMEDSFSNIVSTIEEGRGIYDNIQKSIMLLLSGNFGEVLIIFLAVLLGFNLPLTAILLLWINLITDGAPALAFSIDPYNKNIMKQKPKNIKESILPKNKLILIALLGFTGSLIALIIFKISGGNSNNLILGQTMVFNFVVIYETILIFIIRKEYGVKLFSNIWLYLSIILSFILQLIIMYSPLSKIFKVVPLNTYEILILFISGIIFYLLYKIYYVVNNSTKLRRILT